MLKICSNLHYISESSPAYKAACEVYKLKDQGDAHHANQEHIPALLCYTNAIDMLKNAKLPTREQALLYSNRARSRYEIGGNLDGALKDAQKALKLDSSFLNVRISGYLKL